MRKDVADLANGMDLATFLDQSVEERRLRRRHREVAPVSGTLKLGDGFPNKWPRDDAADIVLVQQRPARSCRRS